MLNNLTNRKPSYFNMNSNKYQKTTQHEWSFEIKGIKIIQGELFSPILPGHQPTLARDG